MKNDLAALFNDKQIKRFSSINGLILIIFFLIAIWKWSSLPSQLPLFYSLPRSSEQLGTPVKLLILPSFAIIFSLINFYLALILYTKERLASIILTVMATITSFLLLMTFIKIIFIVS